MRREAEGECGTERAYVAIAGCSESSCLHIEYLSRD